MPTYTATNRPLGVTTPLGPDALLLVGLSGKESLSSLYQYDLDLVAERDTDVPFENLLGQPIGVRLAMPKGSRYFHGICIGARQGGSDETFTDYRLEIVPNFWLWTKRQQSRIFQHLSVPDILKIVLKGLDVSFEQQGTFLPRDYCVQYRESDFAFASRLMEEEGIYYFFTHTEKGHQLVLANTAKSHPDLPDSSTLIYKSIHDRIEDDEEVVREWAKRQELTSGKVTLWDHSFELPHKHLEAQKGIEAGVQVGQANHKLAVGNNDRLEIYDYPGAYAQRFSGTDPGGGDRPGDLPNIFEDNTRTVAIRMQQETLRSILIDAASNCAQVIAGHKFTLAQSVGNELTRFARADGRYVVTAVTHNARVSSSYRSGDWGATQYSNTFQCIPYALPYRPPQTTPKPVVPGSQTAVVVGPTGEEIFTDKYSRVKVQFHWDRAGKHNADSSCWVRVATHWAGKQWGIIHIPRIGQEVVVDFLEGDPDRPIIVGSVYNAETMPPYALPGSKTQSGIKTRSSLGGDGEAFNEICFEDKKGSELLSIRAEKDQTIAVENDESHWVGNDRLKTIDRDETTLVHHDRTETVDNNEKITIGVNRTEKVGANEDITIGVNRTEKVGANETISIGANRVETVAIAEAITVGAAQAITVGAARAVTVGAVQTITVGAAQIITVGGPEVENYGSTHSQTVSSSQTVSVGADGTYSIAANRATKVGKDDALNVAKKLSITAGEEITLTTGDASIVMNKNGDITIKGKNITVEGSGEMIHKADKKITMKGQKILQN